MLGRIWQKIKGLDYYLKALLIAMPLTGALLAYLLSIGAADLIFSDWFIHLLSIPTLIANQFSSAAYFGRITDLFSAFKTTLKRNKNELIFTLIGITAGICVGIGLALMNVTIPLSSSLYAFAGVLFTLRHMNIYASLGNRVGRCIDKNSRPFSEKVIVVTCGLLGLTLGIVLFATFTAAMVSVVGLTSFFSGGAAIPVWIAGIIFVLSVSSGFASTADYVSKSISFIRSQFMDENKVAATDKVTDTLRVFHTAKKRKYEYGGSLVGVLIGLVIGATIIGAILATNPALLAGLVGGVACALIIVTGIGIVGSVCSRIGRLIDGFKKDEHESHGHKIEHISRLIDTHDEISINESQQQADPKPKPKSAPAPKKQSPTPYKHSTKSPFGLFFRRRYTPTNDTEQELLVQKKNA
jgi:hypothetical protein